MLFFHQTKHFLRKRAVSRRIVLKCLERHGRDAEKEKDEITIGYMNKDDHNSVETFRRGFLAYRPMSQPVSRCASLTVRLSYSTSTLPQSPHLDLLLLRCHSSHCQPVRGGKPRESYLKATCLFLCLLFPGVCPSLNVAHSSSVWFLAHIGSLLFLWNAWRCVQQESLAKGIMPCKRAVRQAFKTAGHSKIL